MERNARQIMNLNNGMAIDIDVRYNWPNWNCYCFKEIVNQNL